MGIRLEWRGMGESNKKYVIFQNIYFEKIVIGTNHKKINFTNVYRRLFNYSWGVWKLRNPCIVC